jgi:hypothetical protein
VLNYASQAAFRTFRLNFVLASAKIGERMVLKGNSLKTSESTTSGIFAVKYVNYDFWFRDLRTKELYFRGHNGGGFRRFESGVALHEFKSGPRITAQADRILLEELNAAKNEHIWNSET